MPVHGTICGDEADAIAEMKDTCSLDVADRGVALLDEVGIHIGGFTRQRVEQIESKALAKLREKDHKGALAELAENIRGREVSPLAQASEGQGGGYDQSAEDLGPTGAYGWERWREADVESEWQDRVWRAYERASK